MRHGLMNKKTHSLAFGLGLILLMLASVSAQQPPAQAPPASPPAGSEIVLGASCVTADCHGTIHNRKFMHGPVNLNQCEPCHVPVNNKHVFTSQKEGPAQCFICHEQEPLKKVVHAPFKADCTGCHDPHGSEVRHFTKDSGAGLCLKCHTQVTAGKPVIHGPVGMGQCSVCHSAHQSDFKHLLTDAPEKMCFNCHTDVEASLAGAVSIHAPMKGDCTGCHAAHAADHKNLLLKDGRQLCQSCHGDFLKEVAQQKFPHKPMDEGKECQNCHKPHASYQARLLKEDNMQLCLGCHNQELTSGKRTIPNIESQIKSAKFVHGPLRENNCIACHEAHGSNFANILDKEFPANFYAPYKEHAYDLCFNCHDQKLVLTAKSTLTGFRNGDVNLHFLHVNREKGRSCRACHDEHASNQPKHIRSVVPFGNWSFETVFTQTPSGGGCTTGCHIAYKYDREKPVDNKVATLP